MAFTVLDIFLIVLGSAFTVALITLVIYLTRARSLSGRIGSFACSLRLGGRQNWRPGIAQYGVDRIDWFRVFGVSPRPALSWPRATLTVLGPAVSVVVDGQDEPLVLISCRSGAETFELVLGADAYSGMASWLEAAPPGVEPASF